MPGHVSFDLTGVQDSYAHDQGNDGTCYAHTTSTIIVDALRRTAAENIPPRATILHQTIVRFGRDGANVQEVLAWAARTYIDPVLEGGRTATVRQLHSDDDVENAVREDEAKVALTFHLSHRQMDRLQEFFETNPMNILSRADLGAAEGPPRAKGHAVVVENLADYDHGGAHVPSHRIWRFKNSWGVHHGELGSVHVARDAFPPGAVQFFVVDVPTPQVRFRDLFLEGVAVNESLDLRQTVRVDSSRSPLGSGSFGTVYCAKLRGANPNPNRLVVKCFSQIAQVRLERMPLECAPQG